MEKKSDECEEEISDSSSSINYNQTKEWMNLCKKEMVYKDYMKNVQQSNPTRTINDRMRETLINYILLRFTKFLGDNMDEKEVPNIYVKCKFIDFLDTYLSLKPMGYEQLQCLGMSCLGLAIKFEFDYCFVDYTLFSSYSDSAFSKKDVIEMEWKVFTTLVECGACYNVQCLHFINSYFLFIAERRKEIKKRIIQKMKKLTYEILELCLIDYKIWINSTPSIMAQSILFIAESLLPEGNLNYCSSSFEKGKRNDDSEKIMKKSKSIYDLLLLSNHKENEKKKSILSKINFDHLNLF